MDASELFLGIGLIAVSALNSAAVIYLVRGSKPANLEKESPRDEEEAEDEAKGETGETEEEPAEDTEETASSVEEAQDTAGPERPTTKAEILAWRRKILEDLERERGTKVITMIHKKELWTDPGEEPEIGIEDTVKVLMEFRKTPPDKPIDMILHTPGGFAVAAQMMAMAIKFHPAKVTVMVPFYAMSGGSLMSLASDEIRMEKYSVLGPVDPQIPVPGGGEHPAGAFVTLMKTKPIQTISDRMVILADGGNLEIENAKAFVMWLLEDKMDKDQAERVAEFLARGYMSHGTPITLDVVRALGLNVVEGVPDKVYELFKTFAFTGRSYKGG